MISRKAMAFIAAAALAGCVALAGCGGAQPSASSTASSSVAASASSAASSAATSSASASTATYIEPDAAKAAALAHAGIAQADAVELKAELDTDDAVVHYDVEFKAGGMEYDYDINAVTGEVMTSKSEVDD